MKNINQLNQQADQVATDLMQTMNVSLKAISANSDNSSGIKEEFAKAAVGGVASIAGANIGGPIGQQGGVAIGAVVAAVARIHPLPALLVGAVSGRLVGRAVGNVTADVAADKIWDKVKAHVKEERNQGLVQSLRQSYDAAQRRALEQLSTHRNENERNYLIQRFYQRVQQQAYFEHLAPQQKASIEGAISTFARQQLAQFPPQAQATIKRFNEYAQAQGKAFWQLKGLMANAQDVEALGEKTKKLLNNWQVDITSLDREALQKVAQLGSAYESLQQASQEAIKERDEEKKRSAMLAQFAGAEASFQVLGELGRVCNSRGLQRIGAIGQAGVSIASNVALITGSTAGSSLTAFAALQPYAGIAMAALNLFSVFSSKGGSDGLGEMLQQISDEIRALREELQTVRQEMHQRFDHVEEMISTVMKQLDAMEKIVLDQMKQGQRETRQRLHDIQRDLGIIRRLMHRGSENNYLQPFFAAIDALKQYREMNANRDDKIERQLVKLNTWLTDENYLSAVNGYQIFPDKVALAQIWGNNDLLEEHRQIMDLSPAAMGYLARLASTLPGINLDGLSLDKLPNMDLMQLGISQYIHGRSKLSNAHQRIIDPEFARLNAIREVLNNGIAFINQLGAQESVLLNAILSKYKNAQNTMCLEMQRLAIQHLTTDAKLEELEAAPDWVRFPAAITGTTNIGKLGADKIIALCRNHKDLQLPKLITTALYLGLGTLVFNYQCQETQRASTSMNFHGKGWATHNTTRRHVHWQVVIAYELNGVTHPLFELPFSFTPGAHNYTCRSDNQESVQASHQSQVQQDNAPNIAEFILNIWGSAAQLKIKNSYNHAALKQAIISPIVKACMVALIVGDRTIVARRHAVNQNLTQRFLADESLLAAPMKRQDLLRQCLLMYTNLLGYPGHEALKRLPTKQGISQALHAYAATAITEQQAFSGQRIDLFLSAAFQAAQSELTSHATDFAQREHPIKQSLESLLHSLDLAQVATSIDVEPEPTLELSGQSDHDRGMEMGALVGMSILICALHDSGRTAAAEALRAHYPELIEFQIVPGMTWAIQRGILQALSLKLMEAVPALLPHHMDDFVWLSRTFSGTIKEAISNQNQGVALLNTMSNSVRRLSAPTAVAGPNSFFGRTPQPPQELTQQASALAEQSVNTNPQPGGPTLG